ncbi:MAG: hypothetical protein E7074_08390 [Bacteroidales bacterium]|nr:hypothetical protein [Bacteroidales bacterium]
MPRINHISPFSFRPLILAGALLLLCLNSCSRVQSIREARTIVAEADSLRSAGQSLSPFAFHLSPSKSDSTTIASAVSALEPLRLIYPTTYAHANYYYGRLLREAGNHPEAMLAFLRVVHSRTQDHVIKGRSYCNIGIMCGLATEHELAYDMYERSAEEFLKAQDSIAYYYALIDMAFELAEMKQKTLAYDLLNQVIDTFPYMQGLLLSTKAEACFKLEEYDSILYYEKQIPYPLNQEPSNLLLFAQAYAGLNCLDTAIFYANRVMEESSFYGDKYNALYILSHCDSTINKEGVLSLTSERADIQMLHTSTLNSLSQATQLLEQDLSRKPNLTWLWTLLVTLCIIATSISIYIRKKKAKHQLLSQQVESLQHKHQSLAEQNQQLQNAHSEYLEQMKQDVQQLCKNILSSTDPQAVLSWNDYNQMCKYVNTNFFGLAYKLEGLGLVEHEVRFCMLVVLKLSQKEMAEWMRMGYSSIGGKKRDLSKKLRKSSSSLYDFLLLLASE